MGEVERRRGRERELRVRESREGREIERQGTGIGEGFEGCGDPTSPTQSQFQTFNIET